MMKQRFGRTISASVAAVSLQVVFNSIMLFLLYRYLYHKLGVEQIGIWSLVLAATSISRIGDMGLSAGVVRYVAQALGQGNPGKAADVIQTVALTIAASMGVLLLAGYPIFLKLLGHVVPSQYVGTARSLLPYALASLWALLVVGVLSGGLDGCMRMDLRSLLMGASSLVYLLFTILLVPRRGLTGVAVAQLIQSLGLMVAMWWVLRRQLRGLPWLPWRWRYEVIKEMFSYGANFQVITFAGMLFDPIVKALVGWAGGMSALGLFEMANKLVLQGRSIIVEATRVLVPAVAILQERDQEGAAELFLKAHRLTVYVSALFYGLLGVGLTVFNLLWLGHYEPRFVQFSLWMNFGWYMNTVMGAAYFANMGSGELKPNVISHLMVIILAPAFGAMLGKVFAGNGVAMGTALGLALGSFYLLGEYFRRFGMGIWGSLVPKGLMPLVVFSLLLPLATNLSLRAPVGMSGSLLLAGLGAGALFVFAWRTPERSLILSRRGTA